jgi:membrane protein YqaA with SNARE-associated domain
MNLYAPAAAKVAAPTHHSLMPRWLIHLGGLGLFAVAIVDSSIIPLPLPGSTDLLLLWLVSHHGNAWLLLAIATSGSILGGYTNWATGKKGGETALQKYVQPRLLQRVSVWVEKHSVLSVFLPALLPPPMPLTPFLLAAGALGISRERFLLAFGSARLVRYSLITWLAVTYGRRMVRLWSATLDKWSVPLLWVFAVTLVAGLGYGLWQFRQQRTHPDEIDLALSHSMK